MSTGNDLLDGLDQATCRTVLSRARRGVFRVGHSVYRDGESISGVFFPIDAIVSVVKEMPGGIAVEVATVGREGMTGVGLLLESPTARGRAFVQVAGAALHISAATFQAALQLPSFARRMRQYAMAYIDQIATTAACHAVHEVQQQCARWFLMTSSSTQKDEFKLTQQFVAEMLGVRRSTVSIAAGSLQSAGLIKYSRGVVRILDRTGLERASCECFESVQQEYRRRLSPTPA
jgi:CRP-like cAMP-binding protein